MGMKPKANAAFVERFQQIVKDLGAFQDHEDRIKALEEITTPSIPSQWIPDRDHPAGKLTVTFPGFTQADLDAAVKAERERCVGIIQGVYILDKPRVR